MSTPMGPQPDPATGSTPGGPPPPPGQYPAQQPASPPTDTTQQYPQYGQAAPMPPQPPGLPTEPKKKKTGLIVTLVIVGVVLLAAVGAGAYMIKKNQDATKARETFADSGNDFAKSYNGVTAAAVDTDLDWDETLDKMGPLVEDSESAASSMDKAAKELTGDEADTGKDLAVQATAIAKDMKSLQTELDEFIASDELGDELLDPINQLTTKLSESAGKYNGLVKKWNGLDVVEGSDDLELDDLDDKWADVAGFAQRTLEDQQKAVVADFVVAFDVQADAFVAAAQSFLDTMNSLINTNPAGIPAATQPMLASMTEAVAGMEELAAGLDESSSPTQVAGTAAVLLDLANQMVAASGDATTFNTLADEFNKTLDEFNSAYADYQEMAGQYRDSGG